MDGSGGQQEWIDQGLAAAPIKVTFYHEHDADHDDVHGDHGDDDDDAGGDDDNGDYEDDDNDDDIKTELMMVLILTLIADSKTIRAE